MISSDEKTSFYFRHRTAIEEWAALRDGARAALISEIWAVRDQLQQPAADEEALPYEREGLWSQIGLTKSAWTDRGWPLSVVLAWNTGQLLNPVGSNEWAYVGVYLAVAPDTAAPRGQVATVREGCLPTARTLGLTNQHAHFPVWGYVVPPPGETGLSEYVDQCVGEFRAAWSALNPLLDDIVGR